MDKGRELRDRKGIGLIGGGELDRRKQSGDRTKRDKSSSKSEM